LLKIQEMATLVLNSNIVFFHSLCILYYVAIYSRASLFCCCIINFAYRIADQLVSDPGSTNFCLGTKFRRESIQQYIFFLRAKRPSQDFQCILLKASNTFIFHHSPTSSERSTFAVNENYAPVKRAIYKGFHIHCHNSNSIFNDGYPRATPSTIA